MSQATLAKAEAAKKYIENMYRIQSQNLEERKQRCVVGRYRGSWSAARALDDRSHRKGRPHRRRKTEQELEQAALSEEQRRERLRQQAAEETNYTRLQRQRLCAEDFEALTIIGRGAFGEVRNVKLFLWERADLHYTTTVSELGSPAASVQVRVCREKSTGKIFAMKKLKKAEMVRRGQVHAGMGWCAAIPSSSVLNLSVQAVCWLLLTHNSSHMLSATLQSGRAMHIGLPLPRNCLQVDHVKAERNVLVDSRNDHMVKLYYSFQAMGR